MKSIWGSACRFLMIGFVVVTFAGRAGAQGNWTPSNITTLAWYDAADSGTIAQSGGRVSQWNDKSGNGRHISQAVSAQQPSISGTTITFDGVTNILGNSSPFMYANGSIDIYIVAACATNADKRIVAEANSTNNIPMYSPAQTGTGTNGSKMSAFIRNDTNSVRFDNNINNLSAAGAFNISTQTMYLWRDTGSQMSGQVDAGATTSVGYTRSPPMTLNGFGVGGMPPRATSPNGSAFCNIAVNEIVIAGNLSDADRWKMEGYLAWKWGITGYPSAVRWDNPGASNITCTSACAYATLAVAGDSNAVATLYWGTTDAGQTNGGWAGTNFLGTVSTFAIASVAMTGLNSNTTYFYRFYGTNSVTTNQGYSAAGTFTTDGGPSVNNDGGSVQAGLGIVSLRGILTTGKVADVYIYWGSTDGGQSTNYENVIMMTGAVQVLFSTNLSFSTATNGYYICFASNQYGTAWAPSSTNFSVYMWAATNGGNHEGMDWIVTNGTVVGGTHHNIGRFSVSNGVTITVGSNYAFAVTAATVEVYGTIDATGMGSPATQGTGAGGNILGGSGRGGGGGGYGGGGGAGAGSYGGGAGGNAWGTPNIATATLYPTNFGSGGGRTDLATGGAGGGAIKLVATNSGTMVVNGTIKASGKNGASVDGGSSDGFAGGGGSGGSIWLDCGFFIGTGAVAADGGAGGLMLSGRNAYGGGGGGGRIAVYATNAAFAGSLSVNGGSATSPGTSGSNGTVYVSYGGGWFSQYGGDHGGAEWIITSNVSIGGVHYNIGRFAVSNGVTATLFSVNKTFAVTSATVEVYGTITGNSMGSSAGAGPGAGTGGGGGGYGGAGGNYATGSGGGTAWGTPDIATATLYPTNLGSGGAAGGGGAGGGVIRLSATNNGTMLINGTLTANGGGGAASKGGGAGGSIWLDCGQFNGTGTVSAVGGNGGAGSSDTPVGTGGGGGGGGRIAVQYTNTAFSGLLTANGGSAVASGRYGGKGTISLSPVGWIPCMGGDHGGADWVIKSNSTVGGLHYNIGRFSVSTGVTASLYTQERTFEVTAATVDLYGNISADSSGSVQNFGTGAGTNGTGSNAGGGGGGGYGGAGGNAQGVTGSAGIGGRAWGTPDIAAAIMYPTNWGSGGGTCQQGGTYGSGGSGGGAIKLASLNNGPMLVNGTISSRGGAGSGGNSGPGGGAGGSIWLKCGRLTGTGTVTVAGGSGGSSGNPGGGGGGGRIAAHFTSCMFTNTGTLSAAGGNGPGTAADGAVGTIFLFCPVPEGTIMIVR